VSALGQIATSCALYFFALAGAAAAAGQSGDRAAARTYYAQLLTICKRADSPGRPALQAARRFGEGD